MDSPSPPLVSVVMPAFNAERYVAAAMESVLAQTRRELELIVVDDGSTDGTARVAQGIAARDGRVRYHWQENRNQGAARNAGLTQAAGALVAFMDADDLWLPDKLRVQVVALEEQRADVVFTDAILFADEPGVPLPVGMFGRDAGRWEGAAMFERCVRRNSIPLLSVLVRKSWLDRVGGFVEDPAVKGVEDWELWLRLARAGATFYGMPERLVKYRSHPAQTSRRVGPMRDATLRVLEQYLPLTTFAPVEADGLRRDVRGWAVRTFIEADDFEAAHRELRALDALGGPPRRRLTDALKYRAKLFARQRLGLKVHNVFKR